MRRSALFSALAVFFMLAAPAQAHRSGCHRWHSCPSDSGSYVCGDLGYTSGCPTTAVDPLPTVTIPAAAPPVSGAVRHTTTSLNLRRGPGSDTAKVVTLPAGTAVSLTGTCGGGWCPVQAPQGKGYVSQKYLR